MRSSSVRGQRSPRQMARVVALLAALALIAAACTRSSNDVESGASSPTKPSGGSPPAKSASGPGDFGDLKDVCGPAPSGETNTASDQGVTADEIQVGTIS